MAPFIRSVRNADLVRFGGSTTRGDTTWRTPCLLPRDHEVMAARIRSIVRDVAIAGAAVDGLVQLVPYGRDHTNPPVVREPAWDRKSTRELAARACFDCHSNETHWSWYSHIAPVSWLIQRDVDVGRRAVNFSEWDRPQKEARESADTLLEGEMPPAIYVFFHPSARLSTEEKHSLAQGLTSTIRTQSGNGARAMIIQRPR
jgi:hypothetical protein